MDEIEEIPTRDTERQVVRSAPGDWLVVALAGAVLGGGLLIAAANLVGLMGPDATASASSAATGNQRPSATPLPSASPLALQEKTVDPPSSGPDPRLSGPPIADPLSGGQAVGEWSWLEANAEVVVWSGASVGSQEIVRLAPGEVALVEPAVDASGWLKTVNSLNVGVGYIDASDSEARAAYNLYAVVRAEQSGRIDSVTAVGDRLLAQVAIPGQPWLAEYSSRDGEHWSAVEGMKPDVIAQGPSGWLGLTAHGYAGEADAWESYDGVSWAFSGRLYYFGARALVGSDLGYLLVNSVSDIRYAPTVWYSPDGLTWQESVDPFGRSGSEGKDDSIQLLATDREFIAWTTPGSPRSDVGLDGSVHTSNEHNVPLVAISHDGHEWDRIAMEDANVTGDLQIAVVGDRLVAVAATPGVRTRAWSADLSGSGSITLARDAELEAAIGAMGSIDIASNGREAYAVGYDPHSPQYVSGPFNAETPVHVWRGDGRAWTEVEIPGLDEIGPYPRMGTVGPEGLVLIGSRPTAAGENPIFWHLRTDGEWAAEPAPLLEVVVGPTPETCGPAPSTALQLVLLPTSWGSACFEDQPLTFEAWVTDGGHIPGCGPGTYPCFGVFGEPDWLMRDGSDLLLSPVAWVDDLGFPAITEPSGDYPGLLDFPAGGLNDWVLVTGHFADPASSACVASAPGFEDDWGMSATEFCRQHFVVTEVAAAGPPVAGGA